MLSITIRTALSEDIKCGDNICSIGEDQKTCEIDCNHDCGDGYCDFKIEDEKICPSDCLLCGNSICDEKEQDTCPQDCLCGNGKCDDTEDAKTCEKDCTNVISTDIAVPIAVSEIPFDTKLDGYPMTKDTTASKIIFKNITATTQIINSTDYIISDDYISFNSATHTIESFYKTKYKTREVYMYNVSNVLLTYNEFMDQCRVCDNSTKDLTCSIKCTYNIQIVNESYDTGIIATLFFKKQCEPGTIAYVDVYSDYNANTKINSKSRTDIATCNNNGYYLDVKSFSTYVVQNTSYNIYLYMQNFTINSTVSSTLINFPAYVQIDTATLISASKMQNDCDDIRITTAVDNPVSYEIENCNANTTIIWFLVSSFTNLTNLEYHMYYGNTTVTNGQNKAGPWINNYTGVYHFDNVTTATTELDSTGVNHLVNQSGANNDRSLSSNLCKFGLCKEKNTTNTYSWKIAAFNQGTTFYTSHWLWSNSSDSTWMYESYSAGCNQGGVFRLGTGGTRIDFPCSAGGAAAGSVFNSANHYIGTLYSATAKIFVDTIEKQSRATMTFPGSQLLYFAEGMTDTATKTHVYDEWRVSSINRTSDWKTAEYAQKYTLTTNYNLDITSPYVNITSPNNGLLSNTNIFTINASILESSLHSIWYTTNTSNVSLLNRSNLVWSNRFSFFGSNSDGLVNEVNAAQIGITNGVILNASGANFVSAAAYGSYINISALSLNNFTIFVQFTPYNITDCDGLVSQRSFWDTYSNGAISLDACSGAVGARFLIWNGTGATINLTSLNLGVALPLNVQSTLTVSRNNNNFSMYLNGVYYNSANVINYIYNTTKLFSLGLASGGAELFNGSISNVKIYNSSLTTSEIYTLATNNVSFSQTLPQGNNIINVTASDLSGNVNTTSLNLFIDTITPQISISYPTLNAYYTFMPTINYTVVDANISSCNWTKNTVSQGVLANCNNITGQTWNQGLNTVQIGVNDTLGNYNTTTISFYVDNVGPSINIINPADYAQYAYMANIPVNFTVSDVISSIDKCWWSNATGSSNHTLGGCSNFTTTEFVDGIYNLTIWANDTLGNVNNVTTRYEVHTEVPVLNLIKPDNGKYLNNSTNILFNFTILDAHSISECQLWTNSTGTWHNNQTLTSVSNAAVVTNFNPINFTDGNYIWNVWCNESHNTATQYSINRTFVVDTIKPVLNIIYPLNLYTYNLMPTINYTATDINPITCYWSNNTGLTNTTLTNCSNIVNETWPQILNTVQIWVNDSAGNIDTESVSFTVYIPSYTAPAGTGSSGGEQQNVIKSIKYSIDNKLINVNYANARNTQFQFTITNNEVSSPIAVELNSKTETSENKFVLQPNENRTIRLIIPDYNSSFADIISMNIIKNEYTKDTDAINVLYTYKTETPSINANNSTLQSIETFIIKNILIIGTILIFCFIILIAKLVKI